ncbi:MAG: EI24 domain-containing protein [Pontixanthobacter sp.]
MNNLPAALTLAVGQLGDPRILRVLAKTIVASLTIFIAAGFGLWLALDSYLARWTGSGNEELGVLIAILVTAVGGWILFRIVALAVLQFFADEIVMAVELRHYPELHHTARDLPWREELAQSAKGILRAVLANGLALIIAIPLIFTAIGPAIVFWAVNAWLLGRELQDMVWLRHRSSAGDPPPLSAATRFLFGGIIAALLAVPFLNLLAPIIGAAGATHLVHRRNGVNHV